MSAPAAARMSGQGVRTVAGLELKQRARTSRWPVVLGAWFLLIAAVALLTWYGISSQDQSYQDLEGATHTESAGRSMYDLTTFFVLGLSMLVVPSLTATSINSDREQGVLATLQTTLLSPADIVIGKWVASICVTLVFLATALPFLIWGWVAGQAGPWPILRSMVALLAVLAVISAIGLMFSTLTARPVGSAVLTYLAVATLVIGTLIAFVLSLKPFESVDTVQVRTIPQSWYEEHPNDNPTTSDCVTTTQEQMRVHTEKTWWLLAMNPVVIVADAGFVKRSDGRIDTSGVAPMAAIAEGVGSARKGPETGTLNWCDFGDTGALPSAPSARAGQPPSWPWGLGILTVIGIGSLVVAIRRTHTPIKQLPNGTRIA